MRLFPDAKILVVDSGPALRGELAGRLAQVGFSVVVVDHGSAVGRLIDTFVPDVAVFEMLDGSVDEVVRTLGALRGAKVIVAIDATAPVAHRMAAIRAGADDVVIKPFDVDELLLRIENVMHNFGTGAYLTFDDVRVDEVGHLAHRGDEELELTVTEFNLLTMFMRNAGRVLSKRQLLETVWGFDDYDVNLVEVHVSALRKKLERSGPRIVQTVRGIGYVMRAESGRHRVNADLTLTPAT